MEALFSRRNVVDAVYWITLVNCDFDHAKRPRNGGWWLGEEVVVNMITFKLP